MSYFKPNKIYRHKNFRDVDMYVVNVLSEDSNSIRLAVKYWNRYYMAFANHKVDEVTVKKHELDDWKSISGLQSD